MGGRSRCPAWESSDGSVILVDTSAWIEYLRATGSRVDLRLRDLLVAGQSIAVTDLVLMELLAGARDDAHRERLRRLLAGCDYLAVEGPEDYERAADLYRLCRSGGLTIRRLPDCLIAVVAMRCDVALLHADRDFDAIARCAPLKIAAA
jgi:predicted nucleic acid-binding protein